MPPRIRDRARTHAPALFVALVLASGCGAPAAETPLKPPAPEPGCAILSINDTYRIESLPRGRGGMARVRTLRKKLEKTYPDLVVLHAGDLLFPSLLSNRYKGGQMIEAVNRLDGREGNDERLFVALGNHEFDKEDPNVLSARLAESEFRWLSSNVHFKIDEEGKPAVTWPEGKVLPRTIVQCGSLKVGIFGVTIGAKAPYVAAIHDPIEAARAQTAALRKEGADAVVGLTHLSMSTDQALLGRLGAEGPDVLVGGHEHQKQKFMAGKRGIYKADAEAVTANVLRIARLKGDLHIAHEWIPLEDPSVPEDADMKSWVDATLRKHEDEYCPQQKPPAGPGCLGEVLATAGEDLVAEELDIRRFETNLGDWILDLALGAFPDAKKRPDVAFVNSGSLRLNLNLPKGEPITRRHIEELFAYSAELRLVEINGETLQQVLNRSIEDWTGQGHFLQIAGLAFEHDPAAKTATRLTLLGDKPHKIGPKDVIYAVTTEFLVTPNPKTNQDGYTMLNPSMVVAKGRDLKQVVVDALGALHAQGKPLAPMVDGRICNTQRKGVCRALP
ncbi:5'-nucleotidase C-terminal domain-containing protein [Polyangium sp. 6x1]|uniref:bifunctional metallophosphatase/5'-nucleotidase n=1 Tax=Polyangium sp. 6x1 TaxID=3042689 RepID=UPI002482F26B|nr:5'-nucleotidase C-terminal domain-containing protein [Polyangium sp. 6x1]MDI1450163.1 5'-nucleotidase C-terminal domain-containing protein [Polyangium sp. 6x1]